MSVGENTVRRILALSIFALVLVLPVFAQTEDTLTVRLGIGDNTIVRFSKNNYEDIDSDGPDVIEGGAVTLGADGNATIYAIGHTNNSSTVTLTVYATKMTYYTESNGVKTYSKTVSLPTKVNDKEVTELTATPSEGSINGDVVANFTESDDPSAIRIVGGQVTISVELDKALQGTYESLFTLDFTVNA